MRCCVLQVQVLAVVLQSRVQAVHTILCIPEPFWLPRALLCQAVWPPQKLRPVYTGNWSGTAAMAAEQLQRSWLSRLDVLWQCWRISMFASTFFEDVEDFSEGLLNTSPFEPTLPWPVECYQWEIAR